MVRNRGRGRIIQKGLSFAEGKAMEWERVHRAATSRHKSESQSVPTWVVP